MTDLGRRTFFAAVWGFFSATGKRVITLGSMIVLARLLPPRDFGIVGFAMVYLTFLEVIGDLGAQSALVYWPERREDAANVAFRINAVAGAFWCAVTLAVAPLLAEFFHEPRLTAIARVLAIAPLIKFLGNAHDALAEKDLRFDARALPELALTFAKGAVAILLAMLGYGVWSLVWGHLAGVTVWTILFWFAVPWRPRRGAAVDLLGPMLRYGVTIAAIELVATIMFYADSVAVGHFRGDTALGLYQMAARIPESSMLVVIWVAASALFPAFSRIHAAGEDVRRAYLASTRCITAVTVPASVGLALLARPIVLVFFGEKWVAAAPILSVLAIYGGFRGIDEVGNVLKATGRTRMLVWMTVCKAAVLVPAVIIAARFSTLAVAWALSGVYAAGATVTTVIAARVIDVRLRALARALAPSVVAAAVMGLVLFAWRRIGTPIPLLQLGVGLALGAAVDLTVLWMLDRDLFSWMKAIVTRRGQPAAAMTGE